jgi:chromosome segregation ATPase
MGKDQIAGLKDRIDRKRDLLQKIAAIKEEFSTPRILALSTKQAASADAYTRLHSFILQYGKGVEAGVPQKARGELETLKSNADRLLKEFNEIKEEKQRLANELEHLQAELMGLDCSADITEIAAQQRKIDKATETVRALTKTIEEQRAVINDNQCAPPKDLYLKRQDLLAEMAIGKDVQKEIQSIDKEIDDKEGELTSAKKRMNDATHTVEGLTRKLAEANSLVDALENDKKEMVIFFLKIEADKAELEYQAIAQDLADIYGRLYALDSMICQLASNRERSFAGGNASRFSIPAFGPNSEGHDWLFNANTRDAPAMLAKEKSRLSDLGVQC